MNIFKRKGLDSLLVVMLLFSCVTFFGAEQSEAKKQNYSPITMKMVLYGSSISFNQSAMNYAIKKVKDRFNVNLQIDYYDPNTYYEKINVLWAAGDLPDFLELIDTGKQIEAVENKAFVPLTDVAKKWKDVNPLYLESGRFNGQIYGLPWYRPVPDAICYREDWLKKLNLKVPTNPETLYEMLYAFAKKDPDGNGKNDTYGFSMRSDFGMGQPLWGLFLPSAAGRLYYDKATDSIKDSIYLVNDMKKALKWFNRAYKDRVLDPEWVLDKNKNVEQKFVSGKTGMWIKGAQFIASRQDSMAKSFPSCQLATLSTMKGPYGPNYKISSAVEDMMFMTTKCKDIERGKKVLEYWHSVEGVMDRQMGEKGKDWTIENDKLVWLMKGGNTGYNPGALVTGIQNIKPPVPSPLLESSMKAIKGHEVTKNFARFAEAESVNVTYVNINTLKDETLSKMIIGEVPIEKYDEFLEKYKASGGDKMLAEVNRLYKASLGK